jgi:hypothetical protein
MSEVTLKLLKTLQPMRQFITSCYSELENSFDRFLVTILKLKQSRVLAI